MFLKKFLKIIYKSLPYKRDFFTLFKKIYHPRRAVYQHLYFDGWFKVQVRSGSFWMYHYGYEVENEIFWKGLEGWEGTSLKIWTVLSEKSKVILDIGANTGVYALASKASNPESIVLAFEPVKRVYEKLIRNIARNGFDIGAFEVAISDKDGEAVIYDQPTEHIYSVTVGENLSNDPSLLPTTVMINALATIIKEKGLGGLDLVKLDIETHEPEAIAGLGSYLPLLKPVFLIEILNSVVAEKVTSLLKGYAFFKVYDSAGILRQYESIVCDCNDGYNYLAVPNEKRGLINELDLQVVTDA